MTSLPCSVVARFLPLKERSKLAPERMTFYWNRLDKRPDRTSHGLSEVQIFLLHVA